MKNLLVLNKKTIAKLNDNQLTAIKGGKNESNTDIICNYGGCTFIKTQLN